MTIRLAIHTSAEQPALSGTALPRFPSVACSRTLVERAWSGDRGAFDRLWRRHSDLAYGILLSLLPPSDVEDQLQEVAVAAWRALRSLQDPESFGPWLCAIARNKGRNALHKRRANRQSDAGGLLEVAAPSHGDPLEADEILGAIRTLPACYREPLILRLVQGMSGPEIARRTGLTRGSVRVNLHRGMRMLRSRLEDMGFQNPG